MPIAQLVTGETQPATAQPGCRLRRRLVNLRRLTFHLRQLVFHKVCGAGQRSFIGEYIATVEGYGYVCEGGETKAFATASFCPGSAQANKVAALAGVSLKPGKLISADGCSRYQG